MKKLKINIGIRSNKMYITKNNSIGFLLRKSKNIISIENDFIREKALNYWLNTYKYTTHFKCIKNTILKRSFEHCELCRITKIKHIVYLSYKFIGTDDNRLIVGICNKCYKHITKGGLKSVIIQSFN